ncbi:TonB-dependent receptor [Parabacteroides acidifaciens]|uniref:TonB-dependent receptor n=2 Tax=Tannerellaceae TaxID=2005525 RepID=A0A3D8HEK0_9BACT|nr:TonB-dependent receptor [Parabacteroides acidifaciens]RDU49366.1 TonB-dependent receptor [Parabacteroides acidifaciens]RHR58357.1 TonB-dependent receptor [Parabacteroides sp. AF17-28]
MNESKLLSPCGIVKASALCLLMSAFSAHAAFAVPVSASDGNVMVAQQGKTITGVVNDELGPVAGANIVVKGTTNGTMTDMDGHFSISNVPAGAVLQISFIGYLTQEVKVGNQSTITVLLKEDSQTLDEVVVVGYGTMRKSDLTGSISTAKGEEIIKTQSFNALDGLKGKVAGVNIFSNTGQPGGEMRVVIRGVSTIQASSSPLYVVDGVVMSDFQLLNPNDIQSIEVLKDASSAAIYGARGANGVVLVTTKRGDGGKGVHISYDGSVSVGTMAKQMDVMDSYEWMAAFKQGLENANAWQGKNFTTDLSQIFTDERLFNADGSPKYNTNWQDEASRTAVSHNHQISIQRAGDGSSVGAFINYTDQEGILLNSYFKRINAKLAYDDKPTKWLSTSVNLLVNHTWGNRTSDNPYGQGALRTMLEQLPFLPVKLDGEYTQTNIIRTTAILNDKDNPNSGTQGFSPEPVGNPVELLKNMYAMQYRTKIFGNAALTFHLLKGLDLKTQFGVDYQNSRDANYTPFTPRPMINQNSEGYASASNSNAFYWQEETYMNYSTLLDKHSINAMLGLSWQGREYTSFNASDSKFTDDFYGYYNLGKGTDRPGVGSDYDKWTMNSYFLRLAYSYDNKYMATVTGRYDGSSKFGSGNKYAFFPSVGLGWLMSRESFLEDNPTISKLKLHTSYGLTGNSEIGTYRSLATVSQSTTIIGDALHMVSYLDNMPNSKLKWEKTGQFDFGVELGLFKDRLSFDVSGYYKYTSDLLLDRPVPESTGYSSILDNVGAVSNRGVDILVTAHPIQNHDFQWTSTINLGFNRSRVEKLDESASVDPITGKRQITTDGFVGYDMLIREGEPLSSFYGYKRIGIYDGKPENWDPETMNVPSVIGEKVTSKDRTIIGNGLPDWTGSFVNTFNYKNFDLTVDFQYTWGVDVMQEYYHSTVARFLTNGLDRIYQDAWHPTLNPNGQEQALRLNNFGQGANNAADDDWVANGAYLRCNMIQLGYTFDSNLIKSIGLSSLRLYANVNNAFLITASDYLGYDPDNSSRLGGNNWGANRQFFTYPRPRTFMFGVNVAF